jgi:DNA polymerase
MAAPASRDWADLVRTVDGCTACPELAASRTRVVAGVRPAGPVRLMLVGEAPGAQEDEAGRPFVGRSGVLLDQLLAAAGLRRDEVAVTNVLKCRPPRNRTPRRAEEARCRPWLERQLGLADPDLVLALGGTAARWFAGPDARIAALRGQVLRHGRWPVLVTYHPSAAIRFGPRGAPRAALAEDLALAARLLAAPDGPR